MHSIGLGPELTGLGGGVGLAECVGAGAGVVVTAFGAGLCVGCGVGLGRALRSASEATIWWERKTFVADRSVALAPRIACADVLCGAGVPELASAYPTGTAARATAATRTGAALPALTVSFCAGERP